MGEDDLVAYVRTLEEDGLAPASRARATVTARSLQRHLTDTQALGVPQQLQPTSA